MEGLITPIPALEAHPLKTNRASGPIPESALETAEVAGSASETETAEVAESASESSESSESKAAEVVLEEGRRLSESLLWKYQRAFYEQRGIEAWSKGAIPHYITSNPFIAATYAQVLLAFLEDCLATGGVSPEKPLTVLELGAGHGRFGFLFLQKLQDLLEEKQYAAPPLRCVMTDFTPNNLEFFQEHAQLRPFVESGLLDFALFDAGAPEREIRLLGSDLVLSPENTGPLAVIANYVFDSLPQDAFAVKEGRLLENLISLHASEPAPEPGDADSLERFKVSFEQKETSRDYYPDASWNRILAEYQDNLADTSLLLPAAVLRCTAALRERGDGRLLLLSGDKGYHSELALLNGQGAPGMAIHGKACFSLMVNYHALGRWFENQAGLALHPRHEHESLNVSAFLLPGPGETSRYERTRRAYLEKVEDFGPDDFYQIITHVNASRDQLSTSRLLAFLRLSGWDPKLLSDFMPRLMELAPEMDEIARREVFLALERSRRLYFHLGEEIDLLFQCGALLYELGRYSEALDYFQRSQEFYRMEPGTAYNMGMCCFNLRRMNEALEHMELALKLKPNFERARAMRVKLRALY